MLCIMARAKSESVVALCCAVGSGCDAADGCAVVAQPAVPIMRNPSVLRTQNCFRRIVIADLQIAAATAVMGRDVR
jgi:hypothetical protein